MNTKIEVQLGSALLSKVAKLQRAAEQSGRPDRQRLAPAFSPFEFLDTRENGISKVLASLLDPRGNHAQGARFLSSFLEWLNIEWPAAALQSARVRTEAPITKGRSTRRVDILITSGARAIAIENKLAAADQNEQISDYLSHISARYKVGACLVYLTLETGREAPQRSIRPEERAAAVQAGCLQERNYSELAGLLRNWIDLCEAPIVASFVEGLVRHIITVRLEIEDVESADELTSEIVNSPEKLTAALEVYQTRTKVYEALFNLVMKRLRKRVSEKPGWKLVDLGLAKGKPHAAVLITYHADAAFGVGVAFDNSGYRTMYYGLRVANLEGRKIVPGRELLSAVREVLGKSGSTDAWPWWKVPSINDPFFPLEQDYVATSDFWLGVQNGTFADKIFDFAVELHDHLREKKSLGLLRVRRK